MACLQFEFGNVDLFTRICICFIVDLLAQGTQFCESGYQINLIICLKNGFTASLVFLNPWSNIRIKSQ
uniref:Uncharacterized protein n=1 Tax=Lotus japonicus TaxID=34305 RepID=I3S4R6_LOTJA|nr:unknown [Lotus japonicus]